MTPSQLHTHLPAIQLQLQWRTDVHWCWLNMKRYSACWLWRTRKYVGICTYLNLNVSLLGIHTIAIAHSPAIQLQWQWHATLCCCWCWLNTWNGIVLLDEQQVRWYWCMFEFECVIAWYTMHHNAIAIAHPSAIQLQLQWHAALRWCLLNIWNGVILALDEQFVRWCLVHVWIWMCHYLVYDALWHNHNCTLDCYSTILRWPWHTALRWC